MKLTTAWSLDQDSARAVHALADQLSDAIASPHIIFFHATAPHDPAACAAILAARFPSAQLHGSSTCLGVMTAQGFHAQGGFGMGALAIHDDGGAYGVGAASISATGGDPELAAAAALEQALDAAALQGMSPAMLWISAPPGAEEAALRGLESVVGAGVPIAGGSSADNEVAGKWWQLCGQDASSDAVVVTAMLPSTPVSTSFHSGYAPTSQRGVVTSATGRTVHTIDGLPAAAVYDRWTQGQLHDALSSPQNILASSTFRPLGTPVGDVGGAPYYQLAHPAAVEADGSITLFADVAVGQTLVLMEGTPDSLASRAGRVAQSAMDAAGLAPDSIAGALVIYCAGCMLGIQPRMQEVVESLRGALKDRPFLGTFTFGEQGCFVGGENRHGNLMISVLTFAA